MKAFDIALKDMLQSFRSRSSLMFMFVVPVLITGLFVFLFGGFSSPEGEMEVSIPTIYVQVVNLDRSEESMGGVLVDILQSEEIPIPMEVTEAADAAAAREAVDFQEAGIAVIIPENFSAALSQPGEKAVVELYKDPTLSLGPSFITAMINQFAESFSGIRIAAEVAEGQLEAEGLVWDEELEAAFIAAYVEEISAYGSEEAVLQTESFTGEVKQGTDIGSIIQTIMAGMSVFYAFFTGANVMHSIVREEENGTLPRLFTTATAFRTVLYGKFLAAALVVLIQVSVLLLFGSLVFKFSWGEPLLVVLTVLGITLSAASFGIFLISLVKNPAQTGIALGGGVSTTGMIGMLGVMTAGMPNAPAFIDQLTLIVPQGWAVRMIEDVMAGVPMQSSLPFLGGMILWSIILFMIGNALFNRRYV